MESIRVGVIGAGRMGLHHCRIYSSLRQVNFAGIFDIDDQAASRASSRYNIPTAKSVYDLLEQVDAVSIATPTPPHFELVMQCLEKGVNVLVEKPLTETLEQAQEITRVAEASSLIVQVGHIERFNPTYKELKNVIENMVVLAINFNRLSPYKGSNTDVDVVLDLMTHDLDLVLDLIQEEPAHINATGLKVFSDNLDHAVVQLSFLSSPLVTITASRVTEQKIRGINVTAQGAYIEADLMNKNIEVHRRSSGEYLNQNSSNVKYHQESIVERILVPQVEPLFGEIEDFINCISNEKSPRVSARDGMNALQLAFTVRDLINQDQDIPAAANISK